MSEIGGWRHIADLSKGASANAAVKEAFLRGLDVTRFEAREPSLHDAFIVLTQDQEAKAQ